LAIRIESTPVPMLPIFQRDIGSLDFFNANPIVGSMDDSYQKYHNLFHRLSSKDKKNNVISVGDCGMSTVNFSQFLSCLGLTVQETTTLTATFTKTQILYSGYNKMTVKNCTPAGFPYQYCPQEAIPTTTTSTSTTVTTSPTLDTTPVAFPLAP
jgi:hypothetical protein